MGFGIRISIGNKEPVEVKDEKLDWKIKNIMLLDCAT